MEQELSGNEPVTTEKKSLFCRAHDAITALFVRAGLCTVKLFAAVLYGIVVGVQLIFSELVDFLRLIKKVVLWLVRELTASLRRRHNKNKELQKAAVKAKKEGKKEYAEALARFAGSYLFGEDGICYTAFNYIMPIVSIAFLIGVIGSGSRVEYGISVEYNGRELGVIMEESEYDKAEREVLQRTSHLTDETPVKLNAEFSLRAISGSDRILNSDQLANLMLQTSDEELVEAYGIYIDGNFIGAVMYNAPIQEALNKRLMDFHVEGGVTDISYKNKIEYTKGLYLVSSVMEKQTAINRLTAENKKYVVYIAKTGDTAVTIAQHFNMKLEDFESINPNAADGVYPGQILNVTETVSFLPIQYVLRAETISLIDYETVEYETSSLNVGVRSVLVKGIKGEKVSEIEITFVDGIERSRKTIESRVTKEPVVEQIGIGTYSARPESPDTILTGSGEFGWPVDGGYVSDPFISDRNHKGLDIAAPEGRNIYAAADGLVVAAGWNSGGYGYFVEIDHLNGFQTVYAHMSAVYAMEGQTVTRGQLIGAVGTTGHSTGYHCHFEVRYMNVCLNPSSFLNTVGAFDDDDDDDDENASGGDDY